MPWRSARRACAFATWLAEAAGPTSWHSDGKAWDFWRPKWGLIHQIHDQSWGWSCLGKRIHFATSTILPNWKMWISYDFGWDFFPHGLDDPGGWDFLVSTPNPETKHQSRCWFHHPFFKKMLDICPDPRVFFFATPNERKIARKKRKTHFWGAYIIGLQLYGCFQK